jgi:hypothetical protein
VPTRRQRATPTPQAPTTLRGSNTSNPSLGGSGCKRHSAMPLLPALHLAESDLTRHSSVVTPAPTSEVSVTIRPPRWLPCLLGLLLRFVRNVASRSRRQRFVTPWPRRRRPEGGPGGGPLPPAYWPSGSRQSRWCCRGELPGGQGRMSGTPPPRSSPRRSHSPLTACSGTTPRRPRSVARGGDAPSARAASLASFAALAVPGPAPPWPRPWTPTLVGTLVPTRVPTPATRVPPRRPGAPFRLVMPPRGASRPQKPRPTSPPRGSGASARQGALRAIDSFRRSRSWRTCGPRRLRRHHMPADCHAMWSGCVQGGGRLEAASVGEGRVADRGVARPRGRM